MDISEAVFVIVFILGGLVGVFIGIIMTERLINYIDNMIKREKDNE